jgi:hypothetical protein
MLPKVVGNGSNPSTGIANNLLSSFESSKPLATGSVVTKLISLAVLDGLLGFIVIPSGKLGQPVHNPNFRMI